MKCLGIVAKYVGMSLFVVACIIGSVIAIGVAGAKSAILFGLSEDWGVVFALFYGVVIFGVALGIAECRRSNR